MYRLATVAVGGMYHLAMNRWNSHIWNSHGQHGLV